MSSNEYIVHVGVLVCWCAKESVCGMRRLCVVKCEVLHYILAVDRLMWHVPDFDACV